MRWLLALSLSLALTGCNGCGDSAAPTEGAPQVDIDRLLPVGQSKPDAVYKEAYERAKDEIDAENAHDRLREIERSIDREAEPRP